MIQRIQTVYLILGALSLLALFFFGAGWEDPAVALSWYRPAVTALVILTALLALVSVFFYTDRKRQRQFITFVQMVAIVLLLVFYGGMILTNTLSPIVDERVDSVQLTVRLLPVLAYILFFLARRGVERDIELVRSMDRLR